MMNKELFPLGSVSKTHTGYVERLALVLEEVETGYIGNDTLTGQELERMRRLTFFRVDELTLDRWRRESDGYHSRQYWALMVYWLRAWEELYPGSNKGYNGSNDGWSLEEYCARQSMLIELLSARWLTDTEKEQARKLNYYDIRLNWQQDLMNETAYFDIASDVYYRGGLQLSMAALADGVEFDHVFPLEVDGFSYEMFRQNTGRPV